MLVLLIQLMYKSCLLYNNEKFQTMVEGYYYTMFVLWEAFTMKSEPVFMPRSAKTSLGIPHQEQLALSLRLCPPTD